MTSEIDKLKHFHIEDYSGIYFTDELNKNKHIEACPNCVFNNYFCHGLLCNIVVLKVVKDEEMRNNK